MSSDARAVPPRLSNPLPGRRSRLKQILFWIVGLCAIFLAVVVGLVICKDNIFRWIAERNIQQRMGMRASIGELRVGFSSASVLVKHLRIYNPKEFGGTVFFHVPEIYVQADPEKVSAGLFHVKELRFSLAELNVIKNRNGEMTLESLQKVIETNGPSQSASTPKLPYKFDGIDSLTVSLRTIRFTDLQQPKNSYEMDLGIEGEQVKNLKNEDELKAWAVLLAVKIAVQEKYKAEGKPRSKLGLRKFLELLNEK
ncbi:MAG TPA: hypothetical protein VMZ27_08345 [Candidatus Saccharimonadales bacterium]|nr:hypothetical protein [Candidatus Saccharimonadales bacterium]